MTTSHLRKTLKKILVIGAMICSIKAEVIALGTVSTNRGLSIHWPERSDVTGLEMTFLPERQPTNAVTVEFEQGKSIILASELPALPDGGCKIAMRWKLVGGAFSDYRMARMDLWREPVAPPTVAPIHILGATNAVPAYGIPTRSLNGSIPLVEAVQNAFRKPTDPPPPMPPAVGGVQRKFEGVAKPVQEIEPPAELIEATLQIIIEKEPGTNRSPASIDAQRKFFREGGAKGRR